METADVPHGDMLSLKLLSLSPLFSVAVDVDIRWLTVETDVAGMSKDSESVVPWSVTPKRSVLGPEVVLSGGAKLLDTVWLIRPARCETMTSGSCVVCLTSPGTLDE